MRWQKGIHSEQIPPV